MKCPIEQISDKYDRIHALRKQAHELIENHIPQIWKDGDIRWLSPLIYSRIEALMKQISDLKGVAREDKTQIVYRGIFGDLILKEVRGEETY